MKREGHENIKFFVGPEVEHTPAYSKRTLFVVGKQDLNKIVELAREHKATHIFMGANHSFKFDPDDKTHYWDLTIQSLLARGYWVTLDYPVNQHEHILKMLNIGVWTSRMFVPLLSARIPRIQHSNPNLTIKIDDIEFKGTNPGVWCMHYHEVMDSNRFTDWIEYGNDFIIREEGPKEESTPIPLPIPTNTAQVEITKEKSDLTTLRVVESTVKNDGNLGLDPDSKSKLKGEPEKILEKLSITALDAAEAYAGKEPTKKSKK